MKTCILGTGSYLPERVLTNKHLEEMVETNDEWIVTRTGIKERHIDDKDGLTGMAVNAAREALKDAGVSAGDLELIIVATFTADRLIPSAACEVMRELGANCPAFDLNAACSGFVYGLHVADKVIRKGPVLLIGADKLSKVVNWKDRNTCILFGDGAGAVVLGKGEKGLIYSEVEAYPDKDFVLTLDGVNKESDGGADFSLLEMNGQEVFKFATKAMGDMIMKSLEKTGMEPENISWYVPHQANIRIVKAAAARLGIDMAKVYMNIAGVGNTSSASVPIALDEMNRKGLLKEGDLVSMTAFGGGLTAATAIIEWVKGR